MGMYGKILSPALPPQAGEGARMRFRYSTERPRRGETIFPSPACGPGRVSGVAPHLNSLFVGRLPIPSLENPRNCTTYRSGSSRFQ
jgi:hypothetical protein